MARLDEFGDDHSWSAGALVGYWYRPRNSPFGLGLEGDFAWTDFKWVENCGDCNPDVLRSRWNASIRARAGVYVTDNIMLYGTGGWAWPDIGNAGAVWGGGLQFDITKSVAFRTEVLQYNFTGIEDHQLIGRAGFTFNLN